MRKKRSVFFDSLIALALCWSIPFLSNRSDQEVILLMGSLLGLICTFILLPSALRNLNPEKALRSGLKLPLMFLPLLIFLSHPAGSLTLFFIFPLIPDPTESFYWLINLSVNYIIFFLAGLLYCKIAQGKKKSGLIRLLITLLIAGYFGLILYGSCVL